VEFETLANTVTNNGNALKEIGQGTGNGVGTNTSGFSILFAGSLQLVGGFGSSDYTSLWCSTWNLYTINPHYIYLTHDTGSISFGEYSKDVGYSLRCIKDEYPAPILSTPINNSIYISVSPNLTWNSVNGAMSYSLQVSTNSTFTSIVYDQSGILNTNQQINGLNYLTQYYWRVSATNTNGTSDWSAIWSFTTTVLPPNPPTLSSPIDGSIEVSLLPTLYWNVSTSATSYTLQISTNSSFTSYVFNQSGITNTNQQISGLSNFTKYYWRVNAEKNNSVSGWSNTWSFTTIGTIPQKPILSSPSNASIGVSTSPTFIWDSSIGATSYTLQVSTSSSFTSFVYNQSGLTSTNQQVAGLPNSTQYYWRVNATNSYGTSDWSTVWPFTTLITIPLVPLLSAPSDLAGNVAISPILYWNVSNSATSYTLQVSAISDFTTCIYNQGGLVNTNQQISGLSNFTNYYWRVSATNSFETSGWSNIWSFKTISGSCPGTPTVSYQGRIYNTVQIGTQCWLKENLDIGIMIQGNQNATNNGQIEKYCYNNDPNNCTIYGGLYQWNEAMQYVTIPGTQGICPSGWHIPTKVEFEILKTTASNNGNTLKEIGQGTGTNTSGFSALFGGYLDVDGSYGALGSHAFIWSSTEYDTFTGYPMNLNTGHSNIDLNGNSKNSGYSVRCLKD